MLIRPTPPPPPPPGLPLTGGILPTTRGLKLWVICLQTWLMLRIFKVRKNLGGGGEKGSRTDPPSPVFQGSSELQDSTCKPSEKMESPAASSESQDAGDTRALCLLVLMAHTRMAVSV